MTVKLDHHHRLTAHKLFGHPLNHNIHWVDAVSLLARFGEVYESHRGNWALHVDGVTHSFGSTRPRDLTEDQVIRVRHFLMEAGFTPEVLAA